MEIFALFVLAGILGLLPAYIAQSKGRDFGVFWIYGVVLFPIALIHAAVMRPEDGSRFAEHDRAVHGSRKCPFCAELIKREAIVCKHCGRDVKPTAGEVQDQQRQARATETKQPTNLAAFVVLGLIGGAVGIVLLLFLIGSMN